MADPLIQALAERLGRPTEDITKAVGALVGSVRDRLTGGETVQLPGLGALHANGEDVQFTPTELVEAAVNYRWMEADDQAAVAAAGLIRGAGMLAGAAAVHAVDGGASAEPVDAAPEAAAPETAEPEPAAPEAAEPEAAEPVDAEPETAEPEAAEPVDAEPEPAAPETAEPEAAEPVDAEPEAAEPVDAEPEPAAPEAAEPETAEPEPAEPEPAAPETAEPEPAAPETAEPVANETQDDPADSAPDAPLSPPDHEEQTMNHPDDEHLIDDAGRAAHPPQEPPDTAGPAPPPWRTVADAGTSVDLPDQAAESGAAAFAPRARPTPARPAARGRGEDRGGFGGRMPFIIGGAGLVIIILVSLIFWMRRGSDGPPPNTTGDPAAVIDSSRTAETPQDSTQIAETNTPEAGGAVGTTSGSAGLPGAFNINATGYTLIVGSSTSDAGARAVARRLESYGYPVSVLAYASNDGTRYRIGFGRFATVSEADSVRRSLGNSLPADTWVRRIRP